MGDPTVASQRENGPTKAQRSFEQLFWPALAGNVAWSLCSVVLAPGASPTDIWSRFVALLLLAWYSWYGWLRFATIPYRRPSYYFADGIHLITLAAFAIATANHHPWTPYFLGAIFVVAGSGNSVRSDSGNSVRSSKRGSKRWTDDSKG